VPQDEILGVTDPLESCSRVDPIYCSMTNLNEGLAECSA